MEEVAQDNQDTVFKIDGYENVITGLGMKNLDSSRSTKYKAEVRLSDNDLSGMWSSNGLGKRIIKLPLQDAFREGYTITEDDDSEISGYLKEKGLWKNFKICAQWADVFGGCIMVLGIKDGGELKDEVDENDIEDISFAHVFDKQQVEIYQIDTDAKSDNFGYPEFYYVSPVTGAVPFMVHHSRVIRIDGEMLPDRELLRNNYWHDSVFQSIYKEIERSTTSRLSVSKALSELYIYIMRMKGLAQQVAQNNSQKVVERLTQVDITRSYLSMIGIDENESIERTSLTLSGVKDSVDVIDEALNMVTGIPRSLLGGQAPKGLGNSDESGMTFYYDKVANKQEEQLTDPLKKLIRYAMLAENSPSKGNEIEGWSLEWNPIERQSESEIVKNREIQSKVDVAYMDKGVINNTEVRDSRFGGLEQSLDTSIDASNNPPSAEELAMAAQESQIDLNKKIEEEE